MTLSDQELQASSDAGELVVALAGNPNVGKTTLFNALTGLKQKVANYPGVTVEKKVGRCALTTRADGKESACQIIDLPGTYSLASRSPDEHVARQVVLGQIVGTPRPDVIVVVSDASNLERNLFLVTQILELGRPTVVALTMTDVAEKAGRRINVAKLAGHLRVPVVAVGAHKGSGGAGIIDLKKEIARAAGRKAERLELPLPEVMETHVERLKKILQEEKLSPGEQAEFDAHLMLSTGEDEDVPDTRREMPRIRAAMKLAMDEMTAADIDPIAAEIEAHYGYIASVVDDVVVETQTTPGSGVRTTGTDRIDRVLTHKFWGMTIFVGIMGLMFVSIFSWAQPVMDFLQKSVVGGLGDWVGRHMPEGALKDLIVDGVFAGVGNVVVFLPQIAMLFLFLAILEDSGYMSRAAFLMDRVMSRVGLHGKSFIPMLSGYACAVPAIMGTRVIENRRDRLATILVLPLMSCSARLPVYMLMIGLVLPGKPWQQGGVLLSMYLLGTITAFGVAYIFKRTLLKGPAPAFILEMPPYRLPHYRTVITTVTQRSWAFLKRAGTLIFAFSIMMWAGTHYPKAADTHGYESRIAELSTQIKNTSPARDDTAIAAVQQQIDDLRHVRGAEVLEHSVAGSVGHFIAPVFYPLGYDWKLSVGVTGAFFARETIISTLGIVYSVGDVGDETAPLRDSMKADLWPAGSGARTGKPVYTFAVALSLMVFVVYCMQCLSTLAIVKKETGHWKWAGLMFVYMTGLAWVAGAAVYWIAGP